MFKHILCLWTVRERNAAIKWIDTHIIIEDDHAPFNSTQYAFYTTSDLTNEQKKMIRTALNPRDFISEEL